MKKSAIITIALLLSACEGHQCEPKEPGITMSGEAGIGMKYDGGRVSPHSETKVTISLGGSV